MISDLYQDILNRAHSPEARLDYLRDYLSTVSFEKSLELVWLFTEVTNNPPAMWTAGTYPVQAVQKAWDLLYRVLLESDSPGQEALLVYQTLLSAVDEERNIRAEIVGSKLDILVAGPEYYLARTVH